MTPYCDGRRPRSLPGAVSVALALTVVGCAGGGETPRRPRAALPIVVATAITTDGVSLSPDHLGPGPVKLEITNETDASQQLAVQSSGAGSFRQETAPINPQDMAQLRAQLGPGSYTVSVRAPGVRSASLAVRPGPTGAR